MSFREKKKAVLPRISPLRASDISRPFSSTLSSLLPLPLSLIHHVQARPRSPHCRGSQGCDGEIFPMPCSRPVSGYCRRLTDSNAIDSRSSPCSPDWPSNRSGTSRSTSTCPPASSSRYVNRALIPRSRRRNLFFFFFLGPRRVADIGHSMASVFPRARLLVLPRRLRPSPSRSVYFALLA